MTATYVLDVESTGVGSSDQVIELSHHTLPTLKEFLEIANNVQPHQMLNAVKYSDEWLNQRFNPTVPINKHAYAIHKLSKLQLFREPSSLKVEKYLPKDMSYMLGHNIQFDYRLLGNKPEGVKLICTLALVKKLRKEHPTWKVFEIENNQLDTYMKAIYPELTFSPTHNAKDDCIKVILLLCKLLPTMPEIESWEELYNYLTPKKEEKK